MKQALYPNIIIFFQLPCLNWHTRILVIVKEKSKFNKEIEYFGE